MDITEEDSVLFPFLMYISTTDYMIATDARDSKQFPVCEGSSAVNTETMPKISRILFSKSLSEQKEIVEAHLVKKLYDYGLANRLRF